MGFTLMELDTAVKYKVPLITVVYNNDYWGTWTMTGGVPRAVHMSPRAYPPGGGMGFEPGITGFQH